jgi:hypothetical protein
MKPKRILRNIFINVGVLFALTRPLAAATFITFDPPGSTFTGLSAITATGVIMGSYTDASGVTHGFLRTPGSTFTIFDVPGAASTTPTSITPGGVITGWYSDTNGNLHGFLRALDGRTTSFDAPPGFNIYGSIYIFGGPPPSINPAGAIAGTYFNPSFVEHGFLRTPNGTFKVIGPPGESVQTIPTGGINAAGAITGLYQDASFVFHGFLRAKGGAITTFDPPGSTATAPMAINPRGIITGSFSDASGTFHGFVRIP